MDDAFVQLAKTLKEGNIILCHHPTAGAADLQCQRWADHLEGRRGSSGI